MNKTYYRFIFLIFIIFIIGLFPLTKNGFNVGDNIDLFILTTQGRWNEIIGDLPYTHGRFYLLFMPWVYAIPYFIDSPFYFYPLYILPIALCFIAFIKLIQKLFNDNNITLLSSLVLISTFQINGFHSSTTSYPFYFSFSFALILFSYSLFIDYYKNKKTSYLVSSSILMLVASLFYETYLVFYIGFLFIAIWKRGSFKDLIPFIIGGLLYLIPYFVFNHYYPSQYYGLNLSENLNLFGVISTCFSLTNHALPLQVFLEYRGLLTKSIFSIDNLPYLFNALLISILFFIILSKTKIPKLRSLLIFFFIGVFFALASQLFVSITDKYYLKGLNNYIPTYFSFFAYTLSLISIILFLYNLAKKDKFSNVLFRIILSLLILFTSYNTQRMNNAIANDISFSSQRFEILKTIINKDIIPNIESQVLCLEQLHASESSIAKWVTLQSFTWKDYIFRISGKNTDSYDSYGDFYLDNSNLDRMFWVAYNYQDPLHRETTVYLAEIMGKNLRPNPLDNIAQRIIKVNSNSSYFDIPVGDVISGLKIYNIEKFRINNNNLDIIMKAMDNIENDSIWASAIKEKSRVKNISYRRQLREDAQWIIENN